MRIAGQALAGYYPTPAALAPALAARLRATTPQVVMDPCAGDGAAVADLISHLAPALDARVVKHRDHIRSVGNYGGPEELPTGLTPEGADAVARLWDGRDCAFVAVELEKGRATAIRNTLGRVTDHRHMTLQEGDAFAVWVGCGNYSVPPAVRDAVLSVRGVLPDTPGATLPPGSTGTGSTGGADVSRATVDTLARRNALPVASVLYLNPPYDLDPVHGRLEQRFLRRFTGFLRPGGVLLFLVPHHALRASAAFLATHYRDVRCLRFPPEHFAAYKQVVLYGVRRGGSGFDLDGTGDAGDVDAVDGGTDGEASDTEGDITVSGLRPDPDTLARILAWADATPGEDGAGLPECPILTPDLHPGEAPYDLPLYPWVSAQDSYRPKARWAGSWSIPDLNAGLAATDVAHIRASYDPWRSRRKGGASVSARAAYGALTGRGDPIPGLFPASLADVTQRDYPVVMPPKPAHIAAGIAAGVFNGEALAPDGGPGEGPTLLVKGAFRREFTTIGTRENKDGQVTSEERVQQPSLVVTVCDLGSGEYHTLASTPTPALPAGPFTSADVARMTVGDLLTRYGRGLLTTLRARCPVQYDPRAADAEGPGEDGISGPAWVLPPTRRPPYPAQAHAVRALVKVLGTGPVRRDGPPGSRVPFRGKRQSAVTFMGELGTGKSGASLTAAMALGARRILVLCPPHLLDGWREQVELTCHHATVHVLRVPADVDAWAAEDLSVVYPGGVPADAVSVGILSREAAKLGHGLAGVRVCPDCGFDSQGHEAARTLAAALSDAERDAAMTPDHAGRIAQALATLRAGATTEGTGIAVKGHRAPKAAKGPGGGAGKGTTVSAAEGLMEAAATLAGKRAARIERLTTTREDEDTEARNARLRVRCPAELPARPRNPLAAALSALAAALGRWDTGLRPYAASAGLRRAWDRLDAEESATRYAVLSAATDATSGRAASHDVERRHRADGVRRTLDAPAGWGPDREGLPGGHGVSATHRALAMAVEAMALTYAQHGSTWGGTVAGVPATTDLWCGLALLPDSLRLDVVTRVQTRLRPHTTTGYGGKLVQRCPWGREWETTNPAWVVAHILAWSGLLSASEDVATEIAWTWPGYPGRAHLGHTPAQLARDGEAHDPRRALATRDRARVELPHSRAQWTTATHGKRPEGGSTGPAETIPGDLTVGPCGWRDVAVGEAPASTRLAALRVAALEDIPTPSGGSAYSRWGGGYGDGYGEAKPERREPRVQPLTVEGAFLRVRAFLVSAARWGRAPAGTPVDSPLFAVVPPTPGAFYTPGAHGEGLRRLPAVTTPRVARMAPRVLRAASATPQGDVPDGTTPDGTTPGDDDAGVVPEAPMADAVEDADPAGGKARGRGAKAPAAPRKGRPGRCNGALFQAVPEPRRVALARYITRRHPGCFDVLIADEAHENAGENSAQFFAFQRLADLGHPTIMATGSVMNGYAESLFNLWQRFPEFRAEFPREARRAFVERYGYIRVEVKDVDRDTGKVVEFGSVSDRVVRQTREAGNAPGVLPLFILRHLLPRAVTLHKTDLALSLPPCHQRAAYLTPDPEAAKVHEGMVRTLITEVKRGRFEPGLAGKLFGMLSEAPSHLDRLTADVGNRPDGRYTVAYPPSAGTVAGKVVWDGESLPPTTLLAKEAWMLRTIRREVAEGRRVMVMVWHVELMPRLQRLIAHCLADVLAPGQYGTPELPAGFGWRGPCGGEGDVPAGTDPLDAVPPGYWTGLDPATGLPAGSITSPTAGPTTAPSTPGADPQGPEAGTGGKGARKAPARGAKATPRGPAGPTLTGATTGKGVRGGARPVFPTSLPAAAIDRLCPTLNAGKVSAADRIAWINERVVDADARVMIVQPVAVKTGINNLVHFSTQVWMQNPGCDPTTFRQAVGRVDRIGQRASETRIYLGVYDVKSQRAAHTLLLRKTAVALSTDGLDGESALNAAGVGESEGAFTALAVGRQLFDLITAEG